MWNQWGTLPMITGGMPPMPSTAAPAQPIQPPLPSVPPPSANTTAQTAAPTVPFIGPTLPNMQPSTSVPSVIAPAVGMDQSNPYSQYTPAQYAAMTSEQQYALQQHWQQWQAYQQEYAKWHAQYGEQYKREMAAAAAATGISGATSYPGYFQQPPTVQVSQQLTTSQMPQQPPLPPSTQQEDPTQRQNSGKISGQPQMYNKPPPPLPTAAPPTSYSQNQNQWQQQTSNMNINFNHPPPSLNTQYQNQYTQAPPPIQINTHQPPPNMIVGNRKPFGLAGSVQSTPIIEPRNSSTDFSMIPNPNQMNYQSKSLKDSDNVTSQDSRQFPNEMISHENDEYDGEGNFEKDNSTSYDNCCPESNRSGYNETQYEKPKNNLNNKFGNTSGTHDFERNNFNREKSSGNHRKNPFQDKSNNWLKKNERGNNSDRDKSFDMESYRKGWLNTFEQSYKSNSKQENYGSSGSNAKWNDMSTLNDEFTNANRWYNDRNNIHKNVSDWVKPQEQIVTNASQRKAPDLDEASFDKQFRQWEEQFENWKLANANNPDREMYLQYEREFEKQRRRIIERRDLMRKRKMERLGLCNQTYSDKSQTANESPKKSTYDEAQTQQTEKLENSEISRTEYSCNEVGNPKNIDIVQDKPAATSSGKLVDKSFLIESSVRENVELKEEQTKYSSDERKKLGKRKSRFNSPTHETFRKKDEFEEVINLDDDTDEEINKDKSCKTTEKPHIINEIFEKSGGIPGLDLVGNVDDKKMKDVKEKVESLKETELNNVRTHKANIPVNQNTNTNKKIPSLFDIVIEDPNKSPKNLNAQSQVASGAVVANETIPPIMNTAPNIANALQDPNILENITKALAHIQGIPNQTGNLVKAPEILEKLPALLQIVQQQQLPNEGRFLNNGGNSFTSRMGGLQPQLNSNVLQNFGVNMSNDASSSNICGGQFNRADQADHFGGNFQSNFSNQSNNDNNNFYDNNCNNNNDRRFGRNDRNFRGNDRNFHQRNHFKDHNINRYQNRNDSQDNRRSFGGKNRCGGIVLAGRDRPARSNRSQSRNRDTDIAEHKIDSKEIHGFGSQMESNIVKSAIVHNPFKSEPVNQNCDNSFAAAGQGNKSWNNNSGNDEYFVSNIRVFDYQNCGTMQAKVIDYGHKPVVKRDDEFKPVKTFDYGHASKVKNNNNQKIYQNNQNQNEFGNQSNNDVKQNTANTVVVNKGDEEFCDLSQRRNEKPTLLHSDKLGVADAKYENKSEDTQISMNKPDLEEISDTEEDALIGEPRESPPPPPPPMYTLEKPIFMFRSTTSANDKKLKPTVKHIDVTMPSLDNQNTIMIDEIIGEPARSTRPKKICIIMRGPPGSGKSYVAKLLKEKEMDLDNSHVRILSIDDYFIVENDYEDVCPKTGKKIPKKELLYEYDKDMEETYLQYLIKAFKKTITDNLYDFIIIDCNNNSLRSLNEFYCFSKDSGYMPYIIDLKCDVETCLNRNVHERTEQDIAEILSNWNATPLHYLKLDISSLLENTVEMEDAHDMVMEKESENSQGNVESNDFSKEVINEINDDESNDTNDPTLNCGFLKSKWENDTTSENLARLDGTNKSLSKRKAASMEDYLQLDDWQPTQTKEGNKRVRWADIEERRKQDKMRAIGFVVGQTDWKRMMDPNAGRRALNKTKYIERVNKRTF